MEKMKITKYDRSNKENLQKFGIRRNIRVFASDGKYQIWFYGWLIEI